MNYHTDIVIFFIGEACLVEGSAYSENLTFEGVLFREGALIGEGRSLDHLQ